MVRVGVAGNDLHIAQVNAGIRHGRDKCMSKHIRVRSGDLDAGAPLVSGMVGDAYPSLESAALTTVSAFRMAASAAPRLCGGSGAVAPGSVGDPDTIPRIRSICA